MGKIRAVWRYRFSKYSGWYSVSDEAYYDKDEIKINKWENFNSFWFLCRMGRGRVIFFKLSAWSKQLLNLYANKEILSYLAKKK